MNKLSINKIRQARGTAGGLIVCAVVLTVSTLLAQSSDKPQWPSLADRPKVKEGFTRALTRSATDQAFRDRLLDFTNQENVKRAVQEELNKVAGAENMVIPSEIVLMFYEPQKNGGTTKGQPPQVFKDEVHQNRNYHVFYLPEKNDTTDNKYDTHIMCCYLPW